ncbi:MAG TPA: DciA family protein [Rhizomicrobium sp.]|nr:DciA family protein [Rhizomicrobium sp.]
MAQPPRDKQPDTPPARRNRAEAVSREAAQSGAAAFARAGFSDPALVLRWDAIVGPEIARVARPIRLTEGATGGVLTLRAEPAASVFLQHETRVLCGRINDWLGRPAVARLKFVQGTVSQKREPPRGRVTKKSVLPDDPSMKFRGSEGLAQALRALAAARGRD